MTCIEEVIKNSKSIIFNSPTIQEYCFLYIYDHSKLADKKIDELAGEEETLAAKGYKGIKANDDDIDIINKPVLNKIVHYKKDKYKLIGICLASDKSCISHKYMLEFSETASAEDLFLIQKIFPEFKKQFEEKLKKEKENSKTKILKYIYNSNILDIDIDTDIEKEVFEITTNNINTLELMILCELYLFNLKNEIVNYKNKTAKEVIIEMLENFKNSSIKITEKEMRYSQRNILEIKDEYDVQDLLYFSLKSVFKKTKYEESINSYGGSSKRLDFYLEEEGIIIEVKHVKRLADKELIKQIKDDLQSYHTVPKLLDIIFYIYGREKIQDVNSFKELEGKQTIKDKTFNIKIIIG
jgi:hypothetical protein